MPLDSRILDDLARKLADSVPAGLRDLRTEAEKNFRAVLQSMFTKLDLVTREEFDVQAAVLSHTRERLEELATRLKELEGELGHRHESARKKK